MMVKHEPLHSLHVSTLRAIIDQVAAPPLSALTRQPGVRAVFRITVFHHDGRARDSVATLTDAGREPPRLEVCYRTALGGRPLVHTVPPLRYENFVRLVGSLRFDHLSDQPDLPPYGADLWLVERAAGSFSRSIIIAPDRAAGAYATLAAGIRTYLPEALREVR